MNISPSSPSSTSLSKKINNKNILKSNNKEKINDKNNNDSSININTKKKNRRIISLVFSEKLGKDIKKLNKTNIKNLNTSKKVFLSSKNSKIFPNFNKIKKNSINNNFNNYDYSFPIIHNSISKLNFIQNVSNIFITKSFFEEKSLTERKKSKIKLGKKNTIYIKPKYIISNIHHKKNKSEKNNQKQIKEKENNLYNYYYLNI